MPAIVHVDGRLLPPEQARIPVLDHGFLFGDSVFETLRALGGRCFRWADHLARLHRSARALHLELPLQDEALEALVAGTVAASREPDAAVRLIVTRGDGGMDPDPTTCTAPRVLVFARPRPRFAEGSWSRGVTVRIARSVVAAPGGHHKTGNYLASVLALREAREQGDFEALLLNAQGHAAELATSNLFAVVEGVVVTPAPADGLLEGITRGVVLGSCRELGLPTAQRPLTPEQLRAADEIFLCSTLKTIMPVRAIDGASVGGGGRGPVTLRLQEAHRDAVERDVGVRPPEES